jgi:hypothetical protein
MTGTHGGVVLAASCTGECQKSGPLGLALILLLCVACYFLFKSMSKHLRRVREEFPYRGGTASRPVDEPPAAEEPTPTEPTETGRTETGPTETGPTATGVVPPDGELTDHPAAAPHLPPGGSGQPDRTTDADSP